MPTSVYTEHTKMATSPVASESTSSPDTKELEVLLPAFLRQATAFQQMGKELDNYMRGSRSMKTVVDGINKTVTSLCDKSLPRFHEFEALLEDQAQLWIILETDIQKMGKGFKHFGEQFYMVLKAVDLRKKTRKEYAELRTNYKIKTEGFMVKKSEKEKAQKAMDSKLADCLDIDRCLVVRIKELQTGQRRFVADQYSQFMAAQAGFCKDTLQVLNMVPDILTGFLPKKPAQSKKPERKKLDLPLPKPPKKKGY
ncbi:uncharacterized protein LOC110442958 isoform X1 [Mizuhopecten yessoensis]|uniref:uncharacterized protein LOC110442958 isoform X1 n=1 Tax=Mizuhopecten yessoensis TaxID=6573 RepID=UPI000B457A73|nr:uncharacterized protein LOC110442958 isoform X1 [Mizuhopecten yessoensis]